ncbi:MAG TPA: LCP family protein [Pseudonocardiaceae bacterium]
MSGSRRGGYRARFLGRTALVVAAVLVFTVTGYGWVQYRDLAGGIRTSDALGGSRSGGGDVNILIMGLDSRLDENGDPLPADVYAALHAGDQNDGGYNANVLMLLHVPGDGGRATSVSIPRDDYVDLAGSPDGVSKGKVKQAYGLAFDQEHRGLADRGVTDKTELEQRSREAGRTAEINTVRQLLGGVPIDHFVEVTLVAFFQIAQVVQPVTVCVRQDTRDRYSGADFHRGYQQITAAQAVAFVRQRRDTAHPQVNFSDLDRERRQQAFIASLTYQLKQAGTLANPVTLARLISVAKRNIATDAGLDLLSLAAQAAPLTGGNITFVTLPITRFGTDPAGEDVNFVDVTQIRELTHRLLGAPSPAPATPTDPAPSATADAVNATSRDGLAGAVQRALAGKGFTPGIASTDPQHRTRSVIYYGPGGSAVAAVAATLLGGLPVESDPTLEAGRLRVMLGSDFTMPAARPATPGPATPGPVGNATQGGTGPTTPDNVSGGGIPCVT